MTLRQNKLDSVCEELIFTSSELCVTRKVEKQASTTERKLIKMGKTCEATQNDLIKTELKIKTELEMERMEEEMPI